MTEMAMDNVKALCDSVERLDARVGAMCDGQRARKDAVRRKEPEVSDQAEALAEGFLRLVAREFPAKYSAFKSALAPKGEIRVTKAQAEAACRAAKISPSSVLPHATWRTKKNDAHGRHRPGRAAKAQRKAAEGAVTKKRGDAFSQANYDKAHSTLKKAGEAYRKATQEKNSLGKIWVTYNRAYGAFGPKTEPGQRVAKSRAEFDAAVETFEKTKKALSAARNAFKKEVQAAQAAAQAEGAVTKKRGDAVPSAQAMAKLSDNELRKRIDRLSDKWSAAYQVALRKPGYVDLRPSEQEAAFAKNPALREIYKDMLAINEERFALIDHWEQRMRMGSRWARKQSAS